MRSLDVLGFALQSVAGHAGRSALMLLAMAIGVASVLMLTALGDGARRYVTGEFSSLGTHLLFVARNIERIGDHATNIAEYINYMVTGEWITSGRPKADTSSFAVLEPSKEGVVETLKGDDTDGSGSGKGR